MASAATIGDLKRITAPKLADLLLARAADPKDDSIAIVDVRDDDHIGGHINSSLHFPSRTLDATMPTLLRKLEDKETVVFHCALSQQRGPGAALSYMRERAALVQKAKKEGREEKPQTVFVLDRGFVGWQEVYGTDERLTEGYRKELWEDGYWG
ncbi:Rhodanese-like domain-containing protein [Xylariales sp. AK1849]|nr:Rhodanese-like domain-containing protein [Xylariales sp. AK1849]